jgi:hypothetical protein
MAGGRVKVYAVAVAGDEFFEKSCKYLQGISLWGWRRIHLGLDGGSAADLSASLEMTGKKKPSLRRAVSAASFRPSRLS